jgi:GNAT superfamily N-acetyltransferase
MGFTSYPMQAAAVAYIGFAGSILPDEVDEPIVICQEALLNAQGEPAARGRGVGGRVLALVEAEARARGLQRLYLEVEHHNRARVLYGRAGFIDHHRYLMSKFL